MTVFSERRYPVWLIVITAVALLSLALYLVRPIKSLTLPEDGRFIGIMAMKGADDIPFLLDVSREKGTMGITFFHQDMQSYAGELKRAPSLWSYVVRAPELSLFGQSYLLTGNVADSDQAHGFLTNYRGHPAGTWDVTRVHQVTSVDKQVALSYVTTWKQSQELSKLRAKEETELALVEAEDQRLKETLERQAAIQTEGGRKLARARRELDEKTLAKKKVVTDLNILRGRVVLAQRLSPQGKFVALSRQSLKDEAAWFFKGCTP